MARSPRLETLMDAAQRRLDQMTPEEREAMRQAQRESWVRGEMAIGSDADEARARESYRINERPRRP